MLNSHFVHLHVDSLDVSRGQSVIRWILAINNIGTRTLDSQATLKGFWVKKEYYGTHSLPWKEKACDSTYNLQENPNRSLFHPEGHHFVQKRVPYTMVVLWSELVPNWLSYGHFSISWNVGASGYVVVTRSLTVVLEPRVLSSLGTGTEQWHQMVQCFIKRGKKKSKGSSAKKVPITVTFYNDVKTTGRRYERGRKAYTVLEYPVCIKS